MGQGCGIAALGHSSRLRRAILRYNQEMAQSQQWEYVRIKKSSSGALTVLKPDGGSGILPDESIMAALERFGKDGWELVQENTAPDSTETTYTMKRPTQLP